MSFPFVRAAVEAETLSIHGLWNDIGEGSLCYYDGEEFEPVSKIV
jgi:carbonic anhydrase